MKIYINNIRIENTKGSILSSRQLCEMGCVPFENAIICDEDHNELPPDRTIHVVEKDRFFIVRRFVTGG